MKIVEEKVTCDRCGAIIKKIPNATEKLLSELAEGVAREMGWNELCQSCIPDLNGIVTGKLRNKLVLMVEQGKKEKSQKEEKE